MNPKGNKRGNPKGCCDHTGRQFDSITEMCKAWGVSIDVYSVRRNIGWSLERALTKPVRKKHREKTEIKDHLGNVYVSKNKLYQAYNTDWSTIKYRMTHMGMSLEDALTIPYSDNTGGLHKVYDHLGNEFPTKEAMCTYYGIPRATFFRRLRIGWTLEDALTKPLKHVYTPKRKLIDPNGDTFTSIEEMCAKWNIPKKDYVLNIKMGMSVEEALKHKPDVNWHRGATACKDHLGNEFPSYNAMCEHYGISKGTLRGRIDLGWTLKEILENPEKKAPSKPCKDHLGNEYPRQKDMLAAYGVSQTHFTWRKRQGWSLEECLLGRGITRNVVTDCFGEVYPSESIMCLMYNLKTATYYSRLKKSKYDIERILLEFTTWSYDTFGDNLKIIKRLKNYYYEVELDGQPYVMHAKQIIENYREQKLYPMLGYRVICFKENGDASVMIDDKYKIKSYEEISGDMHKVFKRIETETPRKNNQHSKEEE